MSKDDSRQPYPGLRPFEADEADLFFGRELHVDALLARLSRSHFVAVIGESGAGKSSLVRAGLLPALDAGFVVEAGSDWRVALLRPGGAPLAALADALLVPGVLSASGGIPRRDFALAELRRGPLGLVQLVADTHLPRACNVLVVVDQFEELFRYCRDPSQKDEASVFVELLLRASQQRNTSIFVVLTMRSDFVGDCARFRGLPEMLNDNQYLTPRLTREQIAAAIREPARVCGGIVEQALVDELCNAVGDNPDQLPLLQHLMMRVWQRASEGSGRPHLTAATARELGGLTSALNDHAEQIYQSLDERQRGLARTLFKSLTDPLSQRRDLRRDALVSEVADVAGASAAATIEVADVFRSEGRHMLMPPPAVPLDADSRLDISHESLIRQWRNLTEWAREESVNARELQRLSEETIREREGEGELFSGRDLARAQDWWKHTAPTAAWAARYVSPEQYEATVDFISRSAAEAQRRKRDETRVRRVRVYGWVATAAVLILGAIAVAVFNLAVEADNQREQAEAQRVLAKRAETDARRAKENAEDLRIDAENDRAEATRQAKQAVLARAEAHALLLASFAREVRDRDPELAVLLAHEAMDEPGVTDEDGQITSAVRTALAAHVPNVEGPFEVARSRNYIPESRKNYWLDFALSAASVSKQGDLVVPSRDGAALWRAGGAAERRGKHDGRDVVVSAASFSPDGNLIVTSGGDKTARLWRASSGAPVGPPLSHGALINGAVFSRDGKLLVTLGDDSLAKIWTVTDAGATERCTLKHTGEFTTASFSRDERYLVTITHSFPNWQAQVWDLPNCASPTEKPEVIPSLAEIRGVKWASFSPYGAWLGVVTTDGTAHLLSAASPDWPRREIPPDVPYEFGAKVARSQDYPPPLAWSSDGRYVAVGGADHVIRIIALDGTATVQLRGHTGRLRSLSFHPSADVLLSTSADKTARIWRLTPDKRLFEVLVLRGHREPVGSGAFLPGNGVVTAGDDGRVRRWMPSWSLTETARERTEASNAAPPEEAPDGAPPPSPDCAEFLGQSDDRRLAWYCAEENVMLIARKGPSRSVRVKFAGEVKEARAELARFSPSGNVVAVAFDDYSVRLFDSRTGRPGATMRGHTADVRQIAFSADEVFGVSTSRDGTAVVWDARRGAEIANLRLPDTLRVEHVSFSRDAASIIFVSDDRRTVWRCYACGSPKDLMAEIEKRKMRPLTADEAARFTGHAHADQSPPGLREERRIR